MSDQPKIRVFSVDDHPLLREGIAAIINNQPDMVMVAQASTGREAIQLFREHRPDVTLMDLRLPDISGIDAMIAIRSEFPDARIVMLTTFEGDVEIQRALAAGARGYVLKNMPPKELVDVVRQVHAGKKRIPQRDRRPARRARQRRSADRARDRRPAARRRRQPEPRHRRAAVHLGRDRQSARQAHHGEARRERSHRGRRDRRPPRNHSVVDLLLPERVTPRFQGLGIRAGSALATLDGAVRPAAPLQQKGVPPAAILLYVPRSVARRRAAFVAGRRWHHRGPSGRNLPRQR